MSFLNNLFHQIRNSEELKEEADKEAFPEDEEEEAKKAPGAEQSESGNPDAEEEYEVVEREILPAKIICPDCGGITLEGLEFCDKCGGELL
jgi:hypothetical protein